jgi:hypothetical protein
MPLSTYFGLRLVANLAPGLLFPVLTSSFNIVALTFASIRSELLASSNSDNFGFSILNWHQSRFYTVIPSTVTLPTTSCGFPLPSNDDLIEAARQHEQQSRRRPMWERGTGFPFLQGDQPVAWIKYSRDRYRLEREAATQNYVYRTLMQQPDLSELICVPQIYRIIQGDDIPYVLIVMEYVHGRTVRQWLEISEESKQLLWGRVLDALVVFLAFQLPEPIPPPGPVGGGRITHLVFGEYAEPEDAPRDFDSVEDLQIYINQTIVSFKLYIPTHPD